MAGKNRVAWHEGMFLRPQHFQAQDRFIDAQLRARVDSSRPWAWGFTQVIVDEDLAKLGKFGVVRASGVMPDGTPFRFPTICRRPSRSTCPPIRATPSSR
jgi:type VI secretion system protein ImpJ